jgi:hypothetical protein
LRRIEELEEKLRVLQEQVEEKGEANNQFFKIKYKKVARILLLFTSYIVGGNE